MTSMPPVELDTVTAQCIADLNKDMLQAMQTAQQPYICRIQGVLQLFVRRESLAGNWELQSDRKTIVRVEDDPR